MKSISASLTELVDTLTELRAGRRISKADHEIFRRRLLADEAQEVNVYLYLKDLISTWQFSSNARAIARDRELEAVENTEAPVMVALKKRTVLPAVERHAA